MAKNASRLISYGVGVSQRRVLSTATRASIGKDGGGEGSSLYSRLAALGGTDKHVSEALNEWIKEGRTVQKRDVIGSVNQLRKYKKYKHAFQLLEWLEKRDGHLAHSDHAVLLDLLAKVEGIDEAEKYFTKLPESAKNRLTYGALLNCYCKNKMTEKAIAQFEKMRELNFVSNCLAYNNLMSLFMRTGEPQKVLSLLQEMKEKNIKPDAYTYAFVMNSYASSKDIEGVEKVMEEMKTDKVKRDWSTYANLATIYVKAGLYDKATTVLRELEKMNNLRDHKSSHILMGLYAYTSNKLGVYRVWESLKSAFPKTTNNDYLQLLLALHKLGDIDGLKKYFEEWESNCPTYDMRLANVLIDYYLSKDMMKEAESLHQRALKRGATPNSKTLEAFVNYYLKQRDLTSALKYLETAAPKAMDKKWNLIFTKYFEGDKDLSGVDDFWKSLKGTGLNSALYDSLLRSYKAAGRTETQLLKSLKAHGIEVSS